MENLTKLAFDSAPIGVVLTENRIIRTCNTMFCDMTGFRMEELVDQSCRILYSSEAEFDRVRDIGIQALSKGEGAVRRMRTRSRLLVQPEPMRSIIGATQ